MTSNSYQIAQQHHQAGRLADAEAIYRDILTRDPGNADALHMLGVLAYQAGSHEAARGLVERAIQMRPDRADYRCNLGLALQVLGRRDEARAAYEAAARIAPDSFEAFYNLGTVLLELDQYPQAAEALARAVSLRPDHAPALANLGDAFFAQSQLNDAIDAYKKSLALVPDSAGVHGNLGIALLKNGDYLPAWEEHEWRWKMPGAEPRPHFHQPAWNGEDLSGKTILIYAEQGFGDTIQFARYLPLVTDRGGKVIFDCQPELVSLFNQSGIQTIARGDPRPEFDLQQALLTLPRIFGTTIDSIPARIPYLRPDPSRVKYWSARMPRENVLKIGLAWTGRTRRGGEGLRSIALPELLPLADIPNTWFASLQHGPVVSQIPMVAGQWPITDWTHDLSPFTETAALIENLDLVVTIDTAVAHLAGALGKPVWILLRSLSDWRWLHGRDDSPWYPTAKLFRQSQPGDWKSAIQRVQTELRTLASQ